MQRLGDKMPASLLRRLEKAKQPGLVLFDVGSVELRLNFGAYYRATAGLSAHLEAEQFAQSYRERKLEERVMRGELKTAQWFDGIRELIQANPPPSDECLRQLLAKRYVGPIPEVLAIKHAIYGAGYAVGILSNTSALDVELISAQWPGVFETYDPAFPKILSFEVGALKPELAIYAAVPRYPQTIFIDDKLSYLRPAVEQFGWRGIHFTPYIDNAEAIRRIRRDEQLPKGAAVANSVEELVRALAAFGIVLPHPTPLNGVGGDV